MRRNVLLVLVIAGLLVVAPATCGKLSNSGHVASTPVVPRSTTPPSASASSQPSTTSTSSVTPPVASQPTPTGPAGASTATAAQQSQPCQVSQATKLSDGGDQSWSAQDVLVFDERDAKGIFQVWTMRPDGSERTCLTCVPRPGLPPVDRHKFLPTWRPQGDWFVVQVELTDHPLSSINGQDLFSELLLNGVWNDLYAVSPDGAQWVRLTDTSSAKTDGAFSAAFSPDGHTLMWSRIIKAADNNENPWGVWRLMLAEFQVTNGVPALTNQRDITPPDSRFVEAHDFSPDGRSVVVSSDHDATGNWQMDIWRIDLANGAATNLTGHNGFWNEHAEYTPDGRHIIFMSGKLYPTDGFKTDLVMIDPDGSHWEQLTYFNVKGHPEYAGHKVMPIHQRWDNTGRRLSVTLQSGDHYPDRELWLLTFTGACGLQN